MTEPTTVEALLDDVLVKEGGFVDHPADRGGATNYGITLATLTRWLGRQATVADVRGLAEATAREIYVTRYYAAPRIDTMPAALRPQLFDMAVNHGPRQAVRMLQGVLDMAGFPCDRDGVIGPATRATAEAAAAAMGGLLVNALAERREAFYLRLVERRASQKVFLRGWLDRARSFRVEV